MASNRQKLTAAQRKRDALREVREESMAQAPDGAAPDPFARAEVVGARAGSARE